VKASEQPKVAVLRHVLEVVVAVLTLDNHSFRSGLRFLANEGNDADHITTPLQHKKTNSKKHVPRREEQMFEEHTNPDATKLLSGSKVRMTMMMMMMMMMMISLPSSLCPAVSAAVLAATTAFCT